MQTIRRDPDDIVSRSHTGAVDQAASLDNAHRKTGKLVMSGFIEARHLGRLTSQNRAAGLTATNRDSLDNLGDTVWIHFANGNVVQEKQRLGALNNKIVDAHRNEVNSDGVRDSGSKRDFELGADAVGATHEDRIPIRPTEEATRIVQLEKPCKTAMACVQNLWGVGTPDERGHPGHSVLPRINVDPGILVLHHDSVTP